MKKNKTILMLAVALVGVLVSCSKHEVEQGEDSNIVRFTGEATTRATGNQWGAGDQIGVTMYNAGKTAVIGGYKNYRYDANADGTSVGFTQKSGDMYFSESTMFFSAYYPYAVGNTNDVVRIDVASNSCIDYMYASRTWYSYSGKTIPLEFKYVLAKVIIKVVSGINSPSLSNLSACFVWGDQYAYSITDLNLKTGALQNIGDDGSNFGYFQSTGAENEYWTTVIPQTMPAGTQIEIYTSAGRAYIPITDLLFEAKEYTYTITLNNEGASLNNVTITDRTKVVRTATGTM